MNTFSLRSLGHDSFSALCGATTIHVPPRCSCCALAACPRCTAAASAQGSAPTSVAAACARPGAAAAGLCLAPPGGCPCAPGGGAAPAGCSAVQVPQPAPQGALLCCLSAPACAGAPREVRLRGAGQRRQQQQCQQQQQQYQQQLYSAPRAARCCGSRCRARCSCCASPVPPHPAAAHWRGLCWAGRSAGCLCRRLPPGSGGACRAPGRVRCYGAGLAVGACVGGGAERKVFMRLFVCILY